MSTELDFAIGQFRSDIAALKMHAALVRLEWLALKHGYDPTQPRVPAGNGSESGRWTDGGGTLAQNLPPRSGRGNRRETFPEATPAQAARLAVTSARARALTGQVRRGDPDWRPEQGLYEGIEGAIANQEAIVRQAEARLRDLARPTIIEQKIAATLAGRGWTTDEINRTISSPVRTERTRDTRFDETTGQRLNDPATGYIASDGSYVIKNDLTGQIVQISNRNDPGWKAPWNTRE